MALGSEQECSHSVLWSGSRACGLRGYLKHRWIGVWVDEEGATADDGSKVSRVGLARSF